MDSVPCCFEILRGLNLYLQARAKSLELNELELQFGHLVVPHTWLRMFETSRCYARRRTSNGANGNLPGVIAQVPCWYVQGASHHVNNRLVAQWYQWSSPPTGRTHLGLFWTRSTSWLLRTAHDGTEQTSTVKRKWPLEQPSANVSGHEYQATKSRIARQLD